MSRPRLLSLVVLLFPSFLLAACTACIGQFDPRPNNAKLHQEWVQSNKLPPKLTAAGDMPVEGAPKVVKEGVTKDEAAAIVKKFAEVGAKVEVK